MNKLLNILLVLIIIGYAAYYIYKLPKFDDGELAPDFKAELVDGTPFEMNDLRGSYILLDFWGSWCGPCRADNPNIVALYDQFHGRSFDNAKDFEVVGVAIERDKNRMLRAIKKDGLRWKYHIPQLDRFDSPIAQQYGVKEIPTKYLIDPDGYIIAVNPSREEVSDILSTHVQ